MEQAKAVATLTADAVSAPAYRSWSGVALALLKRGYPAPEVIEIMRSKITRWARDWRDDRPNRPSWGRYTGADVVAYLKATYKTREREYAAIDKMMGYDSTK
jgi:hypothetical protein